GSDVEADHAIDLVGLRRQHDDGYTCGGRVAPETAAHLEAVQPGQHEIEHHQIRHVGLRLSQRIQPVRHRPAAETVALQVQDDKPANVRLVLHHQNFAGHRL